MKVLLSIVLMGSLALAQGAASTTTSVSKKTVKSKKAKTGAKTAPATVQQSSAANSQAPTVASTNGTEVASNAAGTGDIRTPAAIIDPATGTSGQSSTSVAGATKASPLYSGLLNITAEAIVSDLKDSKSEAPIDNVGTLQVFRKITESQKVGLGYNFNAKIVSDSSQLDGFNGDNNTAFKTLDPTIHHTIKLDQKLWGAPVSVLSRYYVPVSEDTKKTKSLGTFRTQTYITWSMNPRFDISAYGQARFTFNTKDNSNQTVGSDSVMRLIAGPSFGYNQNDNVSAYYTPYLDMKSTGYQRGDFSADYANTLSHEIGLWLTMFNGKFIVNPLWATTGSAVGKSSYEGLGDDVNSVYDLNLIAYF